MPIYEFRCKRCTSSFETIVASAKKDEPTLCPGCGSKETMRLISTFAAQIGSDSGEACGWDASASACVRPG
jgi:putative FmdB family regulatory protein